MSQQSTILTSVILNDNKNNNNNNNSSKKISVTCARCSEQFQVFPSYYNRITSNNWKFHCSVDCHRRRKGEFIFYQKYYWCENCHKWIPKQDAIFKEKGGTNGITEYYKIRKDHYRCPICQSKMRTRKRSRYNNNHFV